MTCAIRFGMLRASLLQYSFEVASHSCCTSCSSSSFVSACVLAMRLSMSAQTIGIFVLYAHWRIVVYFPHARALQRHLVGDAQRLFAPSAAEARVLRSSTPSLASNTRLNALTHTP